MSLDTQVFLLIVVGGVSIIWSFRKAVGVKKEIKEIEYLAFACIWGGLLVTTYAHVMGKIDSKGLSDLIANPFASGLVFPVYGLILGTLAGILDRRLQIRTRSIEFLKYIERKVIG